MRKIIASWLILTLLSPALLAKEQLLVTAESWDRHLVLEGRADKPVVISPLSKFVLSDKTKKVIVLPEKLDLKDEYQEFRLFRNRYVIFGIYIFTSLYYNWLTRERR